MSEKLVHFFWVICEEGQEGEYSFERKDVTCQKCIKEFEDMSRYVSDLQGEIEAKRGLESHAPSPEAD